MTHIQTPCVPGLHFDKRGRATDQRKAQKAKYGGTILASRQALWEAQGPPPFLGAEACHKCDNPACVNPEHLYWGTHSENMRDSSDRNRYEGRHLGATNPLSKLSDDDVRAIRASTESGPVLGARYGVSRQNIGVIRRGETWQHI